MNCYHSFCFLRNRETGKALGSKNHGKISSSQMVWQLKLSLLCERLSWIGITWENKFFQVWIEQGWKSVISGGLLVIGTEGQAKGRNVGTEAPPGPAIPSWLLSSLFLLCSYPSSPTLWNSAVSILTVSRNKWNFEHFQILLKENEFLIYLL